MSWVNANRSRLLAWWAIFLVLGLTRAVVSKDFGLVLLAGTVIIAGFVALTVAEIKNSRA